MLIPTLEKMYGVINKGRTEIDCDAKMKGHPGSEYVLARFMYLVVSSDLGDKLRAQSPTLDALYKKYNY